MTSQRGATGGRLTRSLARVLLAVAGAVVGVLASWLLATGSASADGPLADGPLAGVAGALGGIQEHLGPAQLQPPASAEPVDSLRSLDPQPVRQLAEAGAGDLLGRTGLGAVAPDPLSATGLPRSVVPTVPQVDNALRAGVAGLTEPLTEPLRGAPVDQVRPLTRDVPDVSALGALVDGFDHAVGTVPGAIQDAVGGSPHEFARDAVRGAGDGGAAGAALARLIRTGTTRPTAPSTGATVLLPAPAWEHDAATPLGPVSAAPQPDGAGDPTAARGGIARPVGRGAASSALSGDESADHPGGPFGDPEPARPDHLPGQPANPATLPGPCHCGHDGSPTSGGPVVATTATGDQFPTTAGRGFMTPAAQRGAAERVPQPGVTPD
ncbi:hypothetical protein [Streptoalloteichus hindustanus]|uniref:Uncharacterized protein n=1 Tax=Streptoalloteichus hindustanus TaxID=2017 RepID=A0A1M4V012_STRHI|nr:hypothetical protein [Streptoalloteichus hindustanus]SHE62265.1 hypothetical protein SAMN05444320_101594 [Streptoalloteichus hindustanus]